MPKKREFVLQNAYISTCCQLCFQTKDRQCEGTLLLSTFLDQKPVNPRIHRVTHMLFKVIEKVAYVGKKPLD